MIMIYHGFIYCYNKYFQVHFSFLLIGILFSIPKINIKRIHSLFILYLPQGFSFPGFSLLEYFKSIIFYESSSFCSMTRLFNCNSSINFLPYHKSPLSLNILQIMHIVVVFLFPFKIHYLKNLNLFNPLVWFYMNLLMDFFPINNSLIFFSKLIFEYLRQK